MRMFTARAFWPSPASLAGVRRARRAAPAAQTPAACGAGHASHATICGVPVPPPANLPPAGSGPVIYQIGAVLPGPGQRLDRRPADLPVLHPAVAPSQPSQNNWVPYDAEAEQTMRRRLQAAVGDQLPRPTCRSRSQDYTFSNGVDRQARDLQHGGARAGQDRQLRGHKQIDRTKIDEQLRARSIELRLDSFLDDGTSSAASRRSCAR